MVGVCVCGWEGGGGRDKFANTWMRLERLEDHLEDSYHKWCDSLDTSLLFF